MIIRTFAITLLSLLSFSFEAFASDACKIRNLGWHFYCDPKKQELKEDEASPAPKVDAKTELKQIQEKLEDLKVEAVMNPTPGNIAAYITLQNEIMERSSRFAEVWQRVLWSRPDLDLSVKTPMSTVGNEVRSEIRSSQVKVALSELKERYGLFFFYKSTCVYCVKYAPILKAFSEHHGLNVIPVSLDGAILPEWPESKVDNGQFAKLGLSGKPVPATLLFDNKNKEVVEFGYGLLSMSDLEERMSIVINERVE